MEDDFWQWDGVVLGWTRDASSLFQGEKISAWDKSGAD